MGRIKLFTHTDLDGVGCAVLAKLAWGNNVDIDFCSTGNIDEKVQEFITMYKDDDYEQVFITDLSINDEIALTINVSKILRDKFVIIDHHKTALWLNDYKFAEVVVENSQTGEKESGTSLFYRHLIFDINDLQITPTIDNFVNMVRRYDTWEWTDGKNDNVEKDLNTIFNYYGIVEFLEKMVTRLQCPTTYPNIITMDEQIVLKVKYKDEKDYIDDVESRMEISIIGHHTVGIVYASRYLSIVGNTICKRHPNIDYIIMIDMESGKYSLRAVKDDVDVSEVAKRLGGGGHKAAAGAPIGKFAKYDMMKDLTARLMEGK